VNTNTNTVSPIINVNAAPAQVPATYVYQQPVYQPTYAYTQPTPIVPGVSCNITASQGSIANGQNSYLSWTSTGGVTSANLSDGIGSVAVNGTLAVHPESSRNYVLTVYGYNGQSATCNTYLSVSGAPYVSLTQIPYTGFDFGSFGNTIYWAVLASFALAASYLVVYYSGGATMFATRGVAQTARSAQSFVPAPQNAAGRIAGQATPKPVAAVAPVVEAAPQVVVKELILPTAQKARTTMDSMNIVHSKGNETPRIVIARG
jgi:hypothetical protein